MTTQRIGDVLTMIVAVALTAFGVYFDSPVMTRNRSWTIGAFLAWLLLIIIFRLSDKKSLMPRPLRWQRFYICLAFLLAALWDLVRAVMDPGSGWKSGRMWIYGLSWLLLAIYQLSVFYQTENKLETQ